MVKLKKQNEFCIFWIISPKDSRFAENMLMPFWDKSRKAIRIMHILLQTAQMF